MREEDDMPMLDCRGPPRVLKRIRAAAGGHHLRRAQIVHPNGTDEDLFFCVRCGVWATKRPRLLMARCTGLAQRGSYGEACLEALAQGHRPDRRDVRLLDAHRTRDVAPHTGDEDPDVTSLRLLRACHGAGSAPPLAAHLDLNETDEVRPDEEPLPQIGLAANVYADRVQARRDATAEQSRARTNARALIATITAAVLAAKEEPQRSEGADS